MLIEHASGLWSADGGPIRFFAPPIPVAFPYALRMIIVRLEGGELLVDSPLPLDDALREEVAALGKVAHVVSPNKLHHLYMGEWAEAFPGAKLHASPGLAAKRPDLEFDTTLDDAPDPAWASTLDQVRVRGSFFMEEIVWLHRASRTLLLGDMIENHDPALMNGTQRFFARANRMLAPGGETPLNFRLSFLRRGEARACVERILGWEPERVLLMHGPCVEQDAAGFLRRGFAWLRPAQRST